jgi:hypothetical protein
MEKTVLKGDFQLDQESIQDLFSTLTQKLNPLSPAAVKVLLYATTAEKIGKFIGLPEEKLTQATGLKGTEVTTALEELTGQKILVATDYKELFNLDTKNVPSFINLQKVEGDLVINITISSGKLAGASEKKGKKTVAEPVEPAEELVTE